MFGLMMDTPLLVSSVLGHAERIHADQEVITGTDHGRDDDHTYGGLGLRARQLAAGLVAHGLQPGDRIGTIGWNTFRHLEVFFATTGTGMVCHPINPFLPPTKIADLITAAGDRMVFFDAEFTSLVRELRPCGAVGDWIMLCEDGDDGAAFDRTTYRTLLDAAPAGFAWPDFDERRACALYYTSGTAGTPRGVVASHRSTILHAYASLMPDSFGFSGRDTVLCTAPIFHVNGWGVPLNAVLTGARLVLPGPNMDPLSLVDLMNRTGVTLAVGTPATWHDVLDFLDESGQNLATVRRLFSGGAPLSAMLIEEFELRHGIEVTQGWGMTETGPVATAARLKPGMESLNPHVRAAIKAKQGRPIFGIEVRLVDAGGRTLPWDGATTGQLQVKGPWVASGYYGDVTDALVDGWLPTGDVARIDPDGYIVVTDRLGDVITSGGEWISTLEVEQAALRHPAIRQAAVIGIPHPQWGERPLLAATVWADQTPPPVEDLIGVMSEYVPRWWLPEDVEFLGQLPTGPTGKILKRELRGTLDRVNGARRPARSPETML